MLPFGKSCGDKSRLRVRACKENTRKRLAFGKYKLACNKVTTGKEICGRKNCAGNNV